MNKKTRITIRDYRIEKDGWNYALKNKMKKGDIIYPFYNGTHEWYKKSKWDVILKISKKELQTACLYNFDQVRVLQVLKQLKDENSA